MRRKAQRWLLRGCVDVLPLFLFGWLLYLAITVPDGIWNKWVFVPYFDTQAPFTGFGFLLSVLFLCGIGALRETMLGNRLHACIMGRLPVIGKFLQTSNGNTKIIENIKSGCVLAPFRDSYRFAFILSALEIEDNTHLCNVAFISAVPDTQILKDDQRVIVASDPLPNGMLRPKLIPIEVAVKLTLGGLLMSKDDEKVTKSFIEVPVRDVLAAEGFI